MAEDWQLLKKTISSKTAGVYKIVNITNNKVYIGISTEIKTRVNGHFNKLRKNKHKNPHLQNSFNKYGADKFQVEILETLPSTATDKELLLREHHYQVEYDACNSGYNIRFTDINGSLRISEETKKKLSKSHKGKIISEEARRSLSKALKGRPGTKHTEETKNKIRLANTGRRHTQAAKDKMSKSGLGKKKPPRTQEWRDKQRQANLGKVLTEETKNKIRIANTGRRHTQAAKDKMSASQMGHTVSQAARDKSSATQKGRKMTAKQRASMGDRSGSNNSRAVTIIVIETGMIFTTINDAAAHFKCTRGAIGKMVIKGTLRRIS